MAPIDQILSQASCLRFSIGEIKRATNEFASENCLRKDEIGKVYRGEISEHGYSGKVFVKRMDIWASNVDLEFVRQISAPRHHPNILSLLGFCFETTEKILVYEFLPNGSLYDYLYTNKDRIPRLTVEQRLQICIGTAKGLYYLHSQDDNLHTHRDIRTKSIFLDATLVPKISSLRYKPKIGKFWKEALKPLFLYAAALGYAAVSVPEHELDLQKKKREVYAFGEILLEVLCEKRDWTWFGLPLPKYVKEIMSPECARLCEKLTRDCLDILAEQRPDMNQVLHKLELALELQKQYQAANNEQVIVVERHKQKASNESYQCQSFSLDEIERATKVSSKILGKGAFGKVYYGKISTSGYNIEVAVKFISMDPQREDHTFDIERKLLSACNHVNIISLVGYCNEEDKKILVYEYMPNGSLFDYLYTHKGKNPPLTVEQRLDICTGVAKGLSYLHSRNDYNIIHSDLKTENILLDANLVPKISDFGLSRTRVVGPFTSEQVTRHIQGTEGYLAPECYEPNYKVSRKADVYAFGVILLEVLCERPAWERLVTLALPTVRNGELPKFTPEHVVKSISRECLRACTNLIKACLETEPNNRPFMTHVIVYLDSILTLQKMNSNGNDQKMNEHLNEAREN